MRSSRSLAVAMALVVAAAAWPAAAPLQEPLGGVRRPDEGIKVHGHWLIEVRNPDGRVTARHDFHNAFYPAEGRNFLGNVLGRHRQIVEWRVLLGEIGNAGPCSGPCMISETVGGLVVQGSDVLVLSGSIVASSDGAFDRVATRPIAGTDGRTYTFTEKFLPVPITIVAGQSISVKVTISFS